MTLPVVHLGGPPREQGVRHGQVLRERISRNLAIYFDRFERETHLAREEVLRRARLYEAAIGDLDPDYADGMRGIAEGSGFSRAEVAALNVRYEILYYEFGVQAMAELADGCTSFAVQPSASASGHLLLGQNWDWIPEVQGAVLRTRHNDGLEALAFTEAGIFGGKIGLNSAGLGLAINGITSTDDDWSRLTAPFHVRCYRVLRQHDFAAALAAVQDSPRPCSTNYLLAQAPDRVRNLEAAPDRVQVLECERGCLVHTNHFLDPDALGIVEPPSERRPHSYHRRTRLLALMAETQRIAEDDLERWLRDHDDHPYGLCRHRDPLEAEEEHYVTVTSIIMDLHRGSMRITDGNPCRTPYQRLTLDAAGD